MSNTPDPANEHFNLENNRRHLLVSATYRELEPLAPLYGFSHETPVSGIPYPLLGTAFDLLITGPGTVATAFHTTKALTLGKYATAINVGVAGSFDADLDHGTLMLVTKDRFADMGAEVPNGFIPGEKLPFTLLNHPPFQAGWLIPELPYHQNLPHFPACTAVTSDTIHTTPHTIAQIVDLFQPELESMEGAAFFYTCIQMKLPCLQIRSVSNMVGPRNNANWQLDAAIESLCKFLEKFLLTYESGT
jgi:futalosine hydrolase